MPGVAAQVGGGTLTGRLSDASSLPIPGVPLRLLNQNTGAAASVVPSGEGIYTFANLLPGLYRLEASAPGFAPLVRSDIAI